MEHSALSPRVVLEYDHTHEYSSRAYSKPYSTAATSSGDYGRVVDTLPFTFFDGARPPVATAVSPQGVPLETHTQVDVVN